MAPAKIKSTIAPRAAHHVDAGEIHLQPSLYTQGGMDGICLAVGERTVEEIEERAKREAPQYMHGVLVGVAYVGKRSQEPPSDDLRERQAGRFLFRVMRRWPKGLPHIHKRLRHKTKDRLEERCMMRFGIGGRSFKRAYDWAAKRAVADEFTRRGPKRGPRQRRRRQ